MSCGYDTVSGARVFVLVPAEKEPKYFQHILFIIDVGRNKNSCREKPIEFVISVGFGVSTTSRGCEQYNGRLKSCAICRMVTVSTACVCEPEHVVNNNND